MTIESNPFPIRYSGDGATLTFAVNAYFLEELSGAAHLKVIQRAADGTETVLVQDTDYTVTGAGNASGGEITLTSAPASGETLVIEREVPKTQETDYVANGPLPAESHERALDKLTMLVQQQDQAISRAISIPKTDDPTLATELTSSVARANKALIFDASGNITVSSQDFQDVAASATILANAEAARDAALGYANDAEAAYDATVAAPVIAAANTVDNFNGDNSTVAFTLSVEPLNEDNTWVYVDGVYQQKDTYTVSGTTLTFSTAPPTGTDNIEVNIANNFGIGTPSDDTVSTVKIQDDAVTTAKIAAGAVDTTELATDAVETANITDANVTTAKIANNAVTTAKINAGAVTVAKHADAAAETVLGNADSVTGGITAIPIGTGLGIVGGELVTTGTGTGDMLAATYDAAGIGEQLTGLTATQTLTNKTLTSPVLNTGVSGTAVKDEDDMASDSATHLATQQSIKAYVDNKNYASTDITDFAEAVDDQVDTLLTAGSNISLTYDDGAGTLTIAATGAAGGGWDFPSLIEDYSAVGDGVTDDTAAVNSAIASAQETFVPNGIFDTTLAATAITSPFQGIGQIRTSDSKKRGKYFNYVDAAPATEGNRDSIGNAFNGDMTHVPFAVEHRITGAATLSQPTSGYKYTHECYPHFTYLKNESGYNHETDGNGGRTASCAYQTKVDNYGQGDCMAYNFLGFVTGTKAGSTDFLANPAVGALAGTLTAGADGVYLNPLEFDLQDNGYDVACIGTVLNLTRTDETGAKNAVWMGHRVQSRGSANIDVAYSASSKHKIGLDFTKADFDSASGNRAITLKADQRIFFNATSTNDWYANQPGGTFMRYNSSNQQLQFVNNNSLVLYAASNQVVLAPSGTARLRVDTSEVIAGASNFYVRPTGVGGSTAFRVNSVAISCSNQLNVLAQINYSTGGGSYKATSASSGSASALPANPAGYILVKIDGSNKKIPYYN